MMHRWSASRGIGRSNGATPNPFWHSKHENTKHETLCTKHETCNTKQWTRNTRHETRNTTHETRHTTHETRNTKPQTETGKALRSNPENKQAERVAGGREVERREAEARLFDLEEHDTLN